VQLSWEFDLGPQNYYSEPLSGTDYQTKFSVQGETHHWWFNPGGNLLLDEDATTNTQYAFRSLGLEVSDTFRPTIRDTITLALDLTTYNYYQTSPSRKDTTWNPHLSALHNLTDKWALLADFGYTTNSSTIPSGYSYNRFVVGAGVSRSL
jgi:hypothetical protein